MLGVTYSAGASAGAWLSRRSRVHPHKDTRRLTHWADRRVSTRSRDRQGDAYGVICFTLKAHHQSSAAGIAPFFLDLPLYRDARLTKGLFFQLVVSILADVSRQ